MDSIFEAYQSINEAGSNRDYIDSVMKRYMTNSGPKPTVKREVGFIKYSLPNGTAIVSDGVGLSVVNAKGKELKYFDAPRKNYKSAADFAIDTDNG